MGAIPCLRWLESGLLAHKPKRVKLTRKDITKLSKQFLNKSKTCSLKSLKKENTAYEEMGDEYNLTVYEEEDENVVLGGDLHNIAVFSNNTDDSYMNKSRKLEVKERKKSQNNTDQEVSSSDSELEDEEIKDTDNVLFLGSVNKEGDADLEVHVYNKDLVQFYVHHHYPLPAFPLCLEYVGDGNGLNIAAVGSLEHDITLWDLDIVNTKDPVKTLYGHTDAVISMSRNHQSSHIMASGSANNQVILWDVAALQRVTTIKHHTDKVQALQWHPDSGHLLLTGCCDRFVRLLDCRTIPSSSERWKMHGEVEQVSWSPVDSNYCLASTATGKISCIDIRMERKKVFSTAAHSEAVTGLAFNTDVGNCLLSVSSDELVKVWEIARGMSNIKLVDTHRPPAQKALHCVSSCPGNPHLFAIGGSIGECYLWDIRRNENVHQTFYE